MCLYSSPSQNHEQFQSFCDSFDILMTSINNLNLKIWIIAADLNGNCSKLYFSDTNDNIGKKLDIIKSTAGFTQIIEKTTYYKNYSPSWIDPIFTCNPSITVDSGIEKALCSSCHHDKMHEKFNFRVCVPPLNFRIIFNLIFNLIFF